MTCRFCDYPLAPGALFCVECGRSVTQAELPVTSRTRPRPRATPVAPAAAAQIPAAEPSAAVAQPVEVAAVQPRAVSAQFVPSPTPDARSAKPERARFVLQFSTGESVVVSGSGLVGRNPSAEPGEYVDDLVAVFDVGKSVSKSHLEFGQESGRFWVSDRYSTNGTLVRRPDVEVVRCEPGKRYFVERGTRVEVGDQFFVVS